MQEPRMIGKWLIGSTLGVGGFSKVKLGVHCDSGEKAALKILPRSRFRNRENESARRQVEAEVRAMSRIQHENVIRLIDVGFNEIYPKTNGTSIEVMLVVLEFASGGEFFDFLSYTGKYSEDIARDFFKQLIGGLEACHVQGVAHRDVKPENLLLDDQFRLKIADFGFSRVLQIDESMQTQCGTRGYMAPEIIENSRYTMKTDIFAAGVVLFIMLAGFPPFQIAKRTDWWFHKLIVGRQNLFWQAHCRTAQFSDSAKDLIEKLLAPDPAARATLDQIKSHPWFAEPSRLTREQIFLDLSDRKLRVDERKEEEKRQAMAAANQAAGAGDTFRDINTDAALYDEELELHAEDSQLPSAIPDMQFVAGKRAAHNASPAGGNSGDSDASADPSSTSPAPEVYEQSKHVQSYTQFLSNRPATEIFQRIMGILHELNPMNVEGKPIKHKIKVAVDDDLHFQAKIYRNADMEGLHQVVFSRRKGDPFAYKKLFDQIQSKLGDLMYNASADACDDDDDDLPS